jgi:hypothetical protein
MTPSRILTFGEKLLQPLTPFVALFIANAAMGKNFLDNYVSLVALLSIQVNMVKSGTELVTQKSNGITPVQWILLSLSLVYMTIHFGVFSACLTFLAAMASIGMEIRKKRGLLLGYFSTSPLIIYGFSFLIAFVSDTLVDPRATIAILGVWFTVSLLMSVREQALNGSFVFSLSTLNNWKETILVSNLYENQTSEVFLITRVASVVKIPLNIFDAYSLNHFHMRKEGTTEISYKWHLFMPNLVLTILFFAICISVIILRPPPLHNFLFEGLSLSDLSILSYLVLVAVSCALGPFMYSIHLESNGRKEFAISSIFGILIYLLTVYFLSGCIGAILIASAVVYLSVRLYLVTRVFQ